MFTRPALVRLGTVWLKPLRSSVPPLATVTAEFGLNVFGAPARNVPALTFVASAVAVGTGERGGAGEHIDGAVAADRGRKHVVGGCVIEVDRTGAGAKCDARRGERAGCRRRIARARADVECSSRTGVRRDRNRPR